MGSVGANGLIRPEWFSYLSPFGWTQATRALTFPDWWPLLVPAVFIVVVIPLAFWLLGLRDLGEGLLPSRAGRARATASLRTPLGFTWYIQRNVFIGWFVGVISLIATIGALVPEMSKVFNSTDTVRMLIESIGGTGALVPAFLSTMLALGVIAITGYVIQGMGKLRAEESSGHTENLLATRLSRYRWLGLHVGMVLLLALVMLVLSGAVMALMTNFGSDYNVDVFDYILAAVSYFPIMLAFAGLYVLLFGLVPRLAGTIVWTYFGFMAFSTWIGPMVGFPEWLMNLSVIKHFASAPASDIQIMPVVVVSVVGVALLTAGTIAWRQRNLVE
jgi:ABC-2 type transport system permease protein